MERGPSFESISETDYTFETEEDVRLAESSPNPEAYPGCLVIAMLSANRGTEGASEAIASTVISSRGFDYAMTCGRCAITLISNEGTIFGASKCPEVVSADIDLTELA